jgi:hypothetical protein
LSFDASASGAVASVLPALSDSASPAPAQSVASPSDLLLCTICQDTLMDGSEREALACGHVFHSDCLAELCNFHGTTAHTQQCPNKCKPATQLTMAHVPAGPDDDDASHPGAASSNPTAQVDLPGASPMSAPTSAGLASGSAGSIADSTSAGLASGSSDSIAASTLVPVPLSGRQQMLNAFKAKAAAKRFAKAKAAAYLALSTGDSQSAFQDHPVAASSDVEGSAGGGGNSSGDASSVALGDSTSTSNSVPPEGVHFLFCPICG